MGDLLITSEFDTKTSTIRILLNGYIIERNQSDWYQHAKLYYLKKVAHAYIIKLFESYIEQLKNE